LCCFFFLVRRLPPPFTLFPYTTLFRSGVQHFVEQFDPRRGQDVVCVLGSGMPLSRPSPQPLPPDGTVIRRELNSLSSDPIVADQDRKSTRLNSSHVKISYAVFCLKKKN